MTKPDQFRVEPTVGPTAPRPVQIGQWDLPEPSSAPEGEVAQKQPHRDKDANPQGASFGGNGLPSTYAQYVVNQDTHQVQIRILDAKTDEVIREVPSDEVEALTKELQSYAQLVSKRQQAAKTEKA